MGETVQRNSLRLSAPQVSPYSFAQYGMERPVPMDTTGGLLPAPLAPLPPTPTPTPTTGLGGGPTLDGTLDEGPLGNPLPFSRDELRGLMGGSEFFRPFINP